MWELTQCSDYIGVHICKDKEFPEDIVTSALIKAEAVVDQEEEVTGSHQS